MVAGEPAEMPDVARMVAFTSRSYDGVLSFTPMRLVLTS
jgi:hypothetical protein